VPSGLTLTRNPSLPSYVGGTSCNSVNPWANKDFPAITIFPASIVPSAVISCTSVMLLLRRYKLSPAGNSLILLPSVVSSISGYLFAIL